MNITMITREQCPYCDNAKAQLVAKGHTYIEMKIGEDILREDVLKEYPNQAMLPIIVWENGNYGGYTDLLDWLHPPLDVENNDGNPSVQEVVYEQTDEDKCHNQI